MSTRKKMGGTVIILVVLSVLFMGARAGQKNTAQNSGLRSDAPPYGLPGPHSVGMRELTTRADHPLEITIWYPAINDDAHAGIIRYTNEIKLAAPINHIAVAYYGGRAIQDAPYDLSLGPYPLVILSPGFSFGASSYAWLAEHLASYGFVVVSPEHREHLDPENELWQATIQRPQDILALLSYVDAQVAPGGAFTGLIETDRTAVVGHSYGGYTSLAAAGARIDTRAFKEHCAAVVEAKEPGAWLCDVLLPHLADMADTAGFDSIPEALWPAWADPRVDAIVPLAGDAFFFGQAGLSVINVPVMAIGGTADQDAPYLWGTYPAYEYVSSSKKVRIALDNAEHMIFTGPCESIPLWTKPFAGEFCSDPGWDRIYAHNLIRHFTTAFLLAELTQDVGAAGVLAPERVNFSGMSYQAQGY